MENVGERNNWQQSYFYTPHLGKILGTLLSFFCVATRRVVRRNLEFAYPELTSGEIRSLSKRVFQHFGTAVLELVQLSYLPRDKILDRFNVQGATYLIDALEKQKGLIIVSAHMGNWEFGLQFFPCYIERPLVGVAKRFRYPPLDRFVHHLRTRMGNKIIYKSGALPELSRTLREGGIVGLLIDMSRRKDGVEVQFFGRKATATPAAALLAIRCNSPVVPAFCFRQADGRFGTQIGPPVEIKRTKDLRTDLQTNTQIMTDRVEQVVRSHPEQWFWAQKRWKEFYPHLYREAEARRQRHSLRRKRKLRTESQP